MRESEVIAIFPLFLPIEIIGEQLTEESRNRKERHVLLALFFGEK